MNTFILDAVALPDQNRILTSFSKHLLEATLRGGDRYGACSAEQRNNLYLLADQTLAFGIPGDLIDIGCYEGRSTRVIASVLEYHHTERKLHLYRDTRNDEVGMSMRVRYDRNFRRSGLGERIEHECELRSAEAVELPATIAFAHFDLNFGELPSIQKQSLLRWLTLVYPLMSPGAIGVLMDYHDPERTVNGWDHHPWVKEACDLFFRSKPECMQILYGGKYSHAFFRKVW